jgi:hypothetical protein
VCPRYDYSLCPPEEGLDHVQKTLFFSTLGGKEQGRPLLKILARAGAGHTEDNNVAKYLNINMEAIEIEEVSPPGNEDINNIVPVCTNLSPTVQAVMDSFRSPKRPHDDTNHQIDVYW